MGIHGGAVDQHLGRGTARTCQCMEEIDPDALGGPAGIAVVERLARSIIDGRVDPAPARLQHMDGAADHPAIVNTMLASGVRR